MICPRPWLGVKAGCVRPHSLGSASPVVAGLWGGVRAWEWGKRQSAGEAEVVMSGRGGVQGCTG